jgi:hypothetical protein
MRLHGSLELVWRGLAALLVLVVAALVVVPRGDAYAVLTHEQVVDLCWKDTLAPMILARFPATTPEQMKDAHAFAYGGSVLQDMGYYPYGSRNFSNLMHYVQTGKFVVNLLKDATDANEYAFALGALAHYAGDTTGHPAVNEVTAMQYPKLAAKYGDSVTYDEDPTAHVRVEFGFDVVEVAKGNFQEDDYRNFIGFKVSKQLMERAFRDTYGFEVVTVMPHEDKAIDSYRHDVSELIPKATRVAWASYGKDITAERHDLTERKFAYQMSKVEYEKNWGSGYQKPSVGARILAFFIRILPKVGPLKALDVKMPNAKEQDIYLKSVVATVADYKQLLAQVAAAGPTYANFELPEKDLDTGKPTEPGEYKLADLTYAQLVNGLMKPGAPPVPAELRGDILAYYSDPNAKDYVKQDPKLWAKTQASVATLKQAQPVVVKVSDTPTGTKLPIPAQSAVGGATAVRDANAGAAKQE